MYIHSIGSILLRPPIRLKYFDFGILDEELFIRGSFSRLFVLPSGIFLFFFQWYFIGFLKGHNIIHYDAI